MWAKNKHLNSTYSTTSKGFTIVELLVVIAVIAILAAITVVSYTGITTRAENAKTIDAVSKYAAALTMYATDNGSYPLLSYPCLDNSDNDCASLEGTNGCFGVGGTSDVAAFDNAILTIVSSLPQTSNQKMSCGGSTYEGAFYYSFDSKSAVIVYFLKGDQDCPLVGSFVNKDTAQQSSVTRCIGYLPTLP